MHISFPNMESVISRVVPNLTTSNLTRGNGTMYLITWLDLGTQIWLDLEPDLRRTCFEITEPICLMKLMASTTVAIKRQCSSVLALLRHCFVLTKFV